MSDGPVEIIFDQQKGTAVFKSKNWEFRTDKLKKDEDYCFEISLWWKNAVLECQFIE